MLKSIEKMLLSFEENHIMYCHWKSNEHLDEALQGDTDLDVLFLPEQRNEIDRVLNICGLKRFRATPLMQYNAIEDYIGYDEEKAKIWHLHTHYRMTLGEKHLKGYTITPWGYEIISNRKIDKSGIYISSPEDEMILLLVRNALKLRWRDYGKEIGKDDLAELSWLIKRIDNDLLRIRARKFLGKKASEELLVLLENRIHNKNQLLHFKEILERDLEAFTGNSKFESWAIRSKRELYWGIGATIRHANLNTNKPGRRMSPSGGLAVAILGCDGAGKSTTIKYVKNEFGKKIDVKTIYLGSGDGDSSLLRKPMKFVAKRVGGKGLGHTVEKEYAEANENKKVSIKAKAYSIAKIVWAEALASEKKRKLKQITKARNNGMLVLIDRYPQTNIPGYNDGPLLTRYLSAKKGVLYKLAKKEFYIYKMANKNILDLAIKLDVPTDIAISRKPEMTVDEIEKKKNAVMKMNVSKDTVIVDTSENVTTSIGKVMSEIWKRI